MKNSSHTEGAHLSRMAIAQKKAQQWLSDPELDAAMIPVIQSLLQDNNPQALLEAFSEDIHFGTGGLRARMGIGSALMNTYTVRVVSMGLAAYLHKRYVSSNIGAVVAYDSRLHSDRFARITADTLARYGIHVHLFAALRPTPLLSFAIRDLKCQCGVVITASHNPKAYNGYKVFGADGAQLIHPQDLHVMEKVQQVMAEGYTNAPQKGRIDMLDTAIDRRYIDTLFSHVQHLGIRPRKEKVDTGGSADDSQHALDKNSKEKLGVVYSPLHGTGVTLVPQILEAWGYAAVHVVDAQARPDGNFPTVSCPNPEEPQAMHMAIETAKARRAALVLATDPDADRVGVAVRGRNEDFELLSGHQVAALLTDHVLGRVLAKKRLGAPFFMVKTIVTTALVTKIAAAHGVPCYATPTGFKYIAALIREKEKHARFVLGVEESCGYLLGDFVRDKDALGACLGIAEMAHSARGEGQTLLDKLEALYRRFGRHEECVLSITKEGLKGMQEIASIMRRLRAAPPQHLGGAAVTRVTDYTKGHVQGLERLGEAALWSSDMLQFDTEAGIRLMVRPSGTEPKIKCYLSVCEDMGNTQGLKQPDHMQRKIKSLKKEIFGIL